MYNKGTFDDHNKPVIKELRISNALRKKLVEKIKED
jgi:hypothetical protein